MEKSIKIMPGVSVSKSIANWIKLMSYDNLIDRCDNADPILDYFNFSYGEKDRFLKEFNGGLYYGVDVVITAFDAANSFGLVDDHAITPQEKKDIFSAIAHCVHNGSIQKYLTGDNSNFRYISGIMKAPTLQPKNPVILDQIVLEGRNFLSDSKIYPELSKSIFSPTLYRN